MLYIEELYNMPDVDSNDFSFAKYFCNIQIKNRFEDYETSLLESMNNQKLKIVMSLLFQFLKFEDFYLVNIVLEKFFQTFETVDPETIHNLWVARAYVENKQNESMLVLQRKLLNPILPSRIKDFFVLNRAIFLIKKSANNSEHDNIYFLLDKLIDNTCNLYIKFLAFLNLIQYLYNKEKYHLCTNVLKKAIHQYKNLIDCKELKVRLYELNKKIGKHTEGLNVNVTSDKLAYSSMISRDNQDIGNLFYFDYNSEGCKKIEKPKSQNSLEILSVKGLNSKQKMDMIISLELIIDNDCNNLIHDFLQDIYISVENELRNVFNSSKDFLILQNAIDSSRDYKANKKFCKGVVKKNPTNTKALLKLCYFYIKENKQEKVKNSLLQIYKIDPGYHSAFVTYSLGLFIRKNILLFQRL